jgi:hypothetical protein
MITKVLMTPRELPSPAEEAPAGTVGKVGVAPRSSSCHTPAASIIGAANPTFYPRVPHILRPGSGSLVVVVMGNCHTDVSLHALNYALQ